MPKGCAGPGRRGLKGITGPGFRGDAACDGRTSSCALMVSALGERPRKSCCSSNLIGTVGVGVGLLGGGGPDSDAELFKVPLGPHRVLFFLKIRKSCQGARCRVYCRSRTFQKEAWVWRCMFPKSISKPQPNAVSVCTELGCRVGGGCWLQYCWCGVRPKFSLIEAKYVAESSGKEATTHDADSGRRGERDACLWSQKCEWAACGSLRL